MMTIRYRFDISHTWSQRIIECATAYRARTGAVPTRCVISPKAKDAAAAPASVGVVKVEKGWGPQAGELDLTA